jgi:hypothetical protein
MATDELTLDQDEVTVELAIPPALKKLRAAVKEAELAYETAKATAATRKKFWEEQQARFNAAFDEYDLPAPLFDAADQDWRDVELVDALGGQPGVTGSLLEKLAEAELRTVGQLSDYLNADGGRQRLTDIKGVGAKKAEAIEEALAAFWARRAAGPAEEATDGDGEQ